MLGSTKAGLSKNGRFNIEHGVGDLCKQPYKVFQQFLKYLSTADVRIDEVTLLMIYGTVTISC